MNTVLIPFRARPFRSASTDNVFFSMATQQGISLFKQGKKADGHAEAAEDELEEREATRLAEEETRAADPA